MLNSKDHVAVTMSVSKFWTFCPEEYAVLSGKIGNFENFGVSTISHRKMYARVPNLTDHPVAATKDMFYSWKFWSQSDIPKDSKSVEL